MVDQRTRDLLQYDALLALVASMAQTEAGAAVCRRLAPELDTDDARASWILVDEAKSILYVDAPPPLDGLVDPSEYIGRLSAEGAVLDPLELTLLGGVLTASGRVKEYLENRSGAKLREIAADLPVFGELERDIERSISPEGEVTDEASPKLAKVRRELSGLRRTITDKLGGIMRSVGVEAALQDDIITTRGDRFVIPVKANLRRDVPGLVHDYSSTGATVFVEPMEMVEDNNRLNFLRRSEQEEAFKVLAALSRRAAEAAEEIQRAARILGSVDALFAAARFSLSHKCVAPDLSEAGDVDLPEARHPLLMARFEPASVVPVDLKQPADKRALVVSGVNAGGKTVALKTLGLLVLMAKTGLHLPVREDARLPLFENVMAVIGDDQDLNSDLSTFSGHVRRLTQVLDRADDGALVLLDELGTGTDPAEGAALALAVLESLHQRGAYLVTATHYHLLKTWAYLTDGVENAAVRTGPDQRPIFGLEYGAPGLSGGLSMARELGLDAELVRRAESYLDEGQKKTLELMEGLERERAALAQARQEHEHQIDELSQAASWIKQREKKRQEAYDSEIRTLRTKIGQTIRRVDDELAEAKRQMKTQKPDKPIPDRLQRIKRDLKNALPKGRSQAPGLAEVRPGERVRVSNLGREGRVVSVNEAKKQAKIDLGGLTADVPWKDLEPAQAQRSEAERESRRVQIKGTASPPREINLLGLTVDEALPEVDKSLDQALMGGIRRLAIIHGVGTGRLRQAVRGLLQEDRRVKSFGPGERRAGGAGVTMVDMNV